MRACSIRGKSLWVWTLWLNLFLSAYEALEEKKAPPNALAKPKAKKKAAAKPKPKAKK